MLEAVMAVAEKLTGASVKLNRGMINSAGVNRFDRTSEFQIGPIEVYVAGEQ